MEMTLANIPEGMETCPKCGQSLLPGQLITGQAWNGDGGEHINCEAETAQAPQFWQILLLTLAAQLL
jgi:hypothetical protein